MYMCMHVCVSVCIKVPKNWGQDDVLLLSRVPLAT